MTNFRENRLKRKLRIKNKINRNKTRTRLTVYRSSKHLYAQVIDDVKNKTLFMVSDLNLQENKLKSKKIEKAKMVGEMIGDKLISEKIKDVVFDRSGYKYHGRVKALVEGVRSKGLKF
ncbi:50S ribosomal protein L18 [Candidatus Gottesmanbacteria bacterium]|nr:50S ribosomal protein L18 [Candidatus Gottesmanbacteria bacterium]